MSQGMGEGLRGDKGGEYCQQYSYKVVPTMRMRIDNNTDDQLNLTVTISCPRAGKVTSPSTDGDRSACASSARFARVARANRVHGLSVTLIISFPLFVPRTIHPLPSSAVFTALIMNVSGSALINAITLGSVPV